MAKKSTSEIREQKPRMRKATRVQKRRLRKKGAKQINIPNELRLTKMAFRMIWQNKRLFGGIMFLYLVLNVIFVRGVSSGIGVSELQDTFQEALGGSASQLVSASGIFVALVGSAGSSNSESASLLQSILFVIVSLALIYAMRQRQAGTKVAIKSAFYESTGQLIPFVIVLFILILKLLPFAIGSYIYQIVLANGVASTGLETGAWTLLMLILTVWSIRMLSSSFFAIYIVTLPKMLPLTATRSAKRLVEFRRIAVIRRAFFLPILLVIFLAITIIPVIMYASFLAEPAFFVLSTSAVLLAHSYLYVLYREMLA